MSQHQQRYSAWTDLDFDKDGRSAGSIFVPVSTDRSAYRAIRVPLIVIRNGEGPACLLMGGHHGDEYEGQIVVASIARELGTGDVSGTLFIMPRANLAACVAGTRLSPVDGGDLNKAFPGEPGGGATAQIAEFVERVILPRVSLWIDLHSGGSCSIPDVCIDERRLPLFIARATLRGLIAVLEARATGDAAR